MKSRRILSIDGGGIKGVFPTSFLAHIESALSLDSVANYFDLIAGTSVGGIIALGLGLGFTARELSDFLITRGPQIFPVGKRATSALRVLFGGVRYDPAPLRRALTDEFGHKRLADSKVRLIVPAFDATQGDIHIYKTAHHPRLEMDYPLTAVEVAMATAAAPTYYPAYDSEHCVTFIDGGLWANDPTALAVVEGIGVLGWSPDDIDVLSIGCTEEVVNFQVKGHDRLFWAGRVHEAAFRGQSRSAQGMARHLTGRDRDIESVVRINPPVEARRFCLDGVNKMPDLRAFAYHEARHALPSIRDRFFSVKAEPFSSLKQAAPS